MPGISGYGVYIPRFRISVEEIAALWKQDGVSLSTGLGVIEKSVPDMDEDTITIAVEAARNALLRVRVPIEPSSIGAVYVGSESHPYTVKPTAVTVAEVLGSTPYCTCADLEFSCKAGTAGIQMILGMVASHQISYGLAIGADCAQGRPSDTLEYTAGSGAAALIIGNDNILAEIEGTFSYTTDTPDFFRREGQTFPVHGSRFTGKPAYFKHVVNSAKGLLERLELTDEDIDYAVFHSPNGKFPLTAAKMLGIPFEKVKPSLIVKHIGNTYSGSSMLGLCAILDIANPGDRILVTSYGSGAGSDSFSFVVTEEIETVRGLAPLVQDYINYKINITYAEYAKYRGKIVTL